MNQLKVLNWSSRGTKRRVEAPKLPFCKVLKRCDHQSLGQDAVDNCDATTDDTSQCEGPIVSVYDRTHLYGAHRATFADVLKETLYVTDMDAMLTANGVRARTYGTHTPACTVVQISRLAFPDCMVEIELIARDRS